MPITADLEVQIGAESTAAWGTQVAPTVLLAGVQDVDINPIVDVQRVEQIDGTRTPARQSLVHMVGGEATISGLVNYDDFPYWLEGLIGRADSDSTGKILFSSDVGQATRVYCSPVESTDTEDAIAYTVCHGDGTNYYSLSGATVNSLSITGEDGAPLEYSVDLIGKSVDTDERAALSNREVVFAMGSHVQLFIDAATDVMGHTVTSDIGWSFELALEANREVKRHLNDLTPTSFREAKMDGKLNLSLEMSAVTEPYIDDIVSATKEGVAKNIRIAAVDGSSNYIYLDFAGVISGEPEIFTDVDGTVSLDIELDAMLSSNNVASDWFAATIRNHVAILP